MVKQLEAKCKNAKVYFRILPVVKICWEHVKILDDRKTIFIRSLLDFVAGKELCTPTYWNFQTDGVFYNNTQDEVYETVVPGILESVISGNNAIILAYGQTGSGKSLTISGIDTAYPDRGIIPRLTTDLFEIKKQLQGKLKLCYQISFIEATKMFIYDLLKDEDNLLDTNSMKNVSIVKLRDEEQALRIIFKAEGRKSLIKDATYNSHAANSVLTFTIVSKALNQTEPTKTVSKIHIVDLAGVDTVGNMSCFYKNVFEIGTANLAKTQLEQFLLVLVKNIPEKILINQRISILVQYLKDSLNSQSILRFIGHIRTSKDDLCITKSMLRFGQIIRGLKAKKSQPDTHENEELKIQHIQTEINQIRKERDLNAMIINSDLTTNINQERLLHMQNVAEEFLHDKTNELVIMNVTDVSTVLKVFKNMYNKLEVEKAESADKAYKKAYEDAMMGVKPTTVKKESMMSSKSSRRPSIKSKDSISTVGQGSKGSRRSGSKQNPTKQGTDKKDKHRRSASRTLSPNGSAKEVMDTDKSLKRSRSSKVFKKASGSKKRSSITSDLQRNDLILEELVDMPVPDDVPPYEEAWAQFTEDDDYEYPEMKEDLDIYEARAKELHLEYLKEVRNLHNIRNLIEARNDDLLKATMQREICNRPVFDEDGNIKLSAPELYYKEALKESEKDLVEQQEKVLGLQAELRIYLQLYNDTKRIINDKFEHFCNVKYRTLVPQLDGSLSTFNDKILCSYPTPEFNTDESVRKDESPADRESNKQYNKLMKYETLKKLMYKQKEKRLQTEILRKKWVQSCKS